MADIWDDNILDTPNWDEHIRNFFLPGDVGCMGDQGIDLSSYYGVRLNADRIHFHTSRGSMPPNAAGRWTATKVQNFYNWMAAGYPVGVTDFHIYDLDQPAALRTK